MRSPDFADSTGIWRHLLSRDSLHLSPRGCRILSRYFLDPVAALSATSADPAPAAETTNAAPAETSALVKTYM